MEYRDELEEQGGLSQQQIEDRLRVKRAQLTVEAEREAKATAKQPANDVSRSSSRCGGLQPVSGLPGIRHCEVTQGAIGEAEAAATGQQHG